MRADNGGHSVQQDFAGHPAIIRQRMAHAVKENTMRASPEPRRVDFPSAGLTVAAYRWDPDGAPRAIVQITHGMGEHAIRYAGLAQALNARGIVVYAQDQRGHGATARSADELGQIGSQGWTELINDIDRLSTRARQEHPAVPLVLLGHSMGSFAVQQYLLGHSQDVSAAVLTGTAVLDLLEPALDLDEPIDLAMFNAPFQPARTDFDWLSRDEAQVDKYVSDPRCGFGIDTAASREMFMAARQLADRDRIAGMRSDLPIYIAVGELDPVGGQLALVNALVDRYTSAGLTDVTLKIYPQARHEIFNETNRGEVIDDLLTWLDHRLGP
ncbi:MAG: lysophospholipase [Streptosporangiaceae bacterium]|jgi:alpha-beta hydrolase superfamily lysophospholipase